jgi:type IV pilus assembly protein PilB
LIADSTVGIIAQRLVRRLCPNCKRERKVYPHEADYLGLDAKERAKQKIFEPVGCQRCNGTGFYGRIGVYEIMEISPRLRGLIASRAPTDTIRQVAVEEGMLTLQESARQLVLDGTTSLQEMLSISVEDMNTILENS